MHTVRKVLTYCILETEAGKAWSCAWENGTDLACLIYVVYDTDYTRICGLDDLCKMAHNRRCLLYIIDRVGDVVQ